MPSLKGYSLTFVACCVWVAMIGCSKKEAAKPVEVPQAPAVVASPSAQPSPSPTPEVKKSEPKAKDKKTKSAKS